MNKDAGQSIKDTANKNSNIVKRNSEETANKINKKSSQTGSKVSQTADKIGNKIESTVDKNIKDPIITTIGNTSNLIQSEVDKLNNGTIDTNTRVVSQQEYNNLKPLEEKYPSTGLLGHILDFNANGTNYNGYNIEIIGKAQDGNLIVQESLKTGALLGGNLNTFYQDIKDNGGTPGTIAKIGTQDSWGVGTNYVVGTNTSDIESKILNQKLSDVKVSGYNLAVLGCAATAGGCILLGNDLGSDINDMLHPDKAGSYNSIRGTIETGIKLTGLPKEYQGLATDVAYFGVSSKLASTGKWENVSNTLNNIKIPGLGGSKEVVISTELGGSYKVKADSAVDDLANNKVLEASKNKGSIGNQVKLKEIEITNKRGEALGEFDEIDLKNKIFYEDKTAKGLDIVNPRTGLPTQTPQQFADKQIYMKTKVRINNLMEAIGTREAKTNSLDVPKIDELKTIKEFKFRLDGNSSELRKATENSLNKLRKEFPDYKFSVEYGK